MRAVDRFGILGVVPVEFSQSSVRGCGPAVLRGCPHHWASLATNVGGQ